MTKTFVLLFKHTLEIHTYTALLAMYEEFPKETIGVSLYTLQRKNLAVKPYENEKVKIMLCMTKTTGEIRRNKKDV